LLANIYLHACDRAFLAYGRGTGLAARRVRYGEDFVILMGGGVQETRREVEQRVGRRELKVNEEKSRVVDARAGRFAFLGFTFCRQRSLRTGQGSSLGEPARKAQPQFRDAGRTLTGRGSHSRPPGEGVERVKR
jgi:RNA-directed DNA polymerase